MYASGSTEPPTFHLIFSYYRIAGNFWWIQFSQFSRLSSNPCKLNLWNKSPCSNLCKCDQQGMACYIVGGAVLECPSAKIRSWNLWRWAFHENWIPRNFPAICYTLIISVFFNSFPYVHGYIHVLYHNVIDKKGWGWMLPNPYFSIFICKNLCISIQIRTNLYTWTSYHNEGASIGILYTIFTLLTINHTSPQVLSHEIISYKHSFVPSPQSLRGEGSGDIGMVSWLYRCVTWPQCYAISVACC